MSGRPGFDGLTDLAGLACLAALAAAPPHIVGVSVRAAGGRLSALRVDPLQKMIQVVESAEKRVR